MPTTTPRKKTAKAAAPPEKTHKHYSANTGLLAIAALGLMAAIVLLAANIASMTGISVDYNQGAAFDGDLIQFKLPRQTKPISQVPTTPPTKTTPPPTTTPPATPPPSTDPQPLPPIAANVCQSMLIPSYFYPGSLWTQSTSANPKPSIMIINPNSGPGSAEDSNYVSTVKKAQEAGIKVLGYVATGYAGRSVSLVKADIDRYRTWYGIDGIFLDEAASTDSKLSYYEDLTNYIHGSTGAALAVLNPGTFPTEGYAKFADILMVFENNYQNYKNSFNLPSWTSNYSENKFVHLVYNTPDSASMQSAVSMSKSRHAGYLYVTSDNLPNPWDTLPSYFSKELTELNKNCI